MQIAKLGRWLVAAVVPALVMAGAALAQSDTLASVKQKGKIVVGVKADYKPFGYTDPSGKIVGLEIDLANDVAKRLGVQIELVPVIAANRMEFLKQGRIDLMIATMAYKPDRAIQCEKKNSSFLVGATIETADDTTWLNIIREVHDFIVQWQGDI